MNESLVLEVVFGKRTVAVAAVDGAAAAVEIAVAAVVTAPTLQSEVMD